MCRENLLDREEHSCHVHDICSENAVSFTDSEENSLHITCYICDKPFTTRKNMYRHIRNVHDVEPSLTGPNSMHCPLCDAEFRTYKDVDGHLLSRHGIEQELEELSFDSLQGKLFTRCKMISGWFHTILTNCGCCTIFNIFHILYICLYINEVFKTKILNFFTCIVFHIQP